MEELRGRDPVCVRSADNCGKRKTDSGEIKPVYSEHADPPCFVLLKERTWRREGIYQIGVEPMFPGYIFVDTEDPQRLEENVHRLAGKAQLLMGGQALAIESSEEILFKELLRGDSQHTVRRFLVQANEAGEIVSGGRNFRRAAGADCAKSEFRKRVVTLEIPFLGKRIRLVIIDFGKDSSGKTIE